MVAVLKMLKTLKIAKASSSKNKTKNKTTKQKQVEMLFLPTYFSSSRQCCFPMVEECPFSDFY